MHLYRVEGRLFIFVDFLTLEAGDRLTRDRF